MTFAETVKSVLHAMQKGMLRIGNKLTSMLLSFIVMLFCSKVYSSENLIYKHYNGIAEYSRYFYPCTLSVRELLKKQGIFPNDLVKPIDPEMFEKLRSVITELVDKNPKCRLLYQEQKLLFTVALPYQNLLLQAIQSLPDNIAINEKSWVEWLGRSASEAAVMIKDQYLQHSIAAHIIQSGYQYTGMYIKYLAENKVGLSKETAIEEPGQGSLLYCFIEGREDQCVCPAAVSYAISAVSLTAVILLSYPLIKHMDFDVPSTTFVVVSLAAMTLTSAWWGSQTTKTVFAAVQLFRTYYLFSGNYQLLFGANQISNLVLAAYNINGLIAIIDFLFKEKYWSKVAKGSPLLFMFSTTLALTSIVSYFRNIHIPEKQQIFLGTTTLAYLVSGYAALQGTQENVPFRHGHIVLTYGGMVINSLITFDGYPNLIPVITMVTIYSLRVASRLQSRYLGVIPEDFDPMIYFVTSILLPSVYILNVPLFD